MESQLEKHRKQASEQSLGSSGPMIYRKALSLIDRYAPQGQHLEFGAGRGQFCQMLIEHFSDRKIVAVDLMAKPDQLNDGIQWHQVDLNKEIELSDQRFDSISALEIIEHLENPRHVFRELYRLLKTGGYLILSTPNNESWRSLLSYVKRGHFVAFTDSSYPAHITALNRKDLLRAANEAGFDLVTWGYSGEGCIPGLTRLTWQKISFGLMDGLRFSDNIFIVLKK